MSQEEVARLRWVTVYKQLVTLLGVLLFIITTALLLHTLQRLRAKIRKPIGENRQIELVVRKELKVVIMFLFMFGTFCSGFILGLVYVVLIHFFKWKFSTLNEQLLSWIASPLYIGSSTANAVYTLITKKVFWSKLCR